MDIINECRQAAEGKTIVKLSVYPNGKFWTLDLDDGSWIGFEPLSGGRVCMQQGRSQHNDQAEPRRRQPASATQKLSKQPVTSKSNGSAPLAPAIGSAIPFPTKQQYKSRDMIEYYGVVNHKHSQSLIKRIKNGQFSTEEAVCEALRRTLRVFEGIDVPEPS